MALSAQALHSLNPENTSLKPRNKVDIHGVERGVCNNCTECPQFIAIPGHVLCAYCGCPPARHAKVEAPESADSDKDLSVGDGRHTLDSSDDEEASYDSDSQSTSSGISSFASRRGSSRRREWRASWQTVRPPPRVKRLMQEEPADRARQIEHAWNETDCSHNIYVKPEDPLTLHRNPVYQSTDAIRCKTGFTEGLHIWEVGWSKSSRGTHPVVGVATMEAPLTDAGYKRLMGSNSESWGWCLKTMKVYHHSRKYRAGVKYPRDADERVRVPDEFLLVLDMDRGTLSFQIGDDFLGVAFSGLRGLKLYPAVSTVWGHCEVRLKYIGSHYFSSTSSSS